MAKFTIINTFKHITFDYKLKPLVICDIDKTFIRPELSSEDYCKMLTSDFPHIKNTKNMIRYMQSMALSIGKVKQTDQEGFNWLIEEIQKLNGKLIFLTARSEYSHTKTLNDLNKVGLKNIQNYHIYYTNAQISKGEYIRKHKLTEGYKHISFIDDSHEYLSSVFDIYPNINCYLFKYE